MTTTVLVAEDQALVRAGIVMLLRAAPDLDVVAEAVNGQEAVELTHRHTPDVVVMDVRMPVLDGVTATRVLCADRPSSSTAPLVKVLVLTTFDDDADVYGALVAGATGYLLKHAAPRDLVSAVRAIAAGDAWIDPAVAGRVIRALAEVPRVADRVPELVARLTPREREVLVLMAAGLSNAEIAERLVVGVGTVKTHVSRALMKTATRDRAQAIALAYRCGLVIPPRFS
ncbi:MAG: response regulator transcription factor [Propionibacteriaceae bacterium]